ncbi:cytochrome P450 [Sphingosinicella soli]|uniref:Cytochrome P450 n=1 Tax=Sphingosinicella soli TaxID=333708 RepID=A0A7W7B0Z2_9SPHN|nr:cytochrome P450 [Sphingosinicella soli]MBB4632007.1 cytochrome P450 [Sphingosinicella soli]
MEAHALVGASAVPAHVPSELFWDHDIDVFAAQGDDPFLVAGRLHDGPDIMWARGAFVGQPAWLLTRFDHINEVFMDARRFSSAEFSTVAGLLAVDWRLNPLEIDPPHHFAYRQVLQPWFTPKAINKLEDMVRSIARELIAEFENSGRCEFVEQFASLFPSYVFLELMGMPRSRLPEFLQWEHKFTRGDTVEVKIAAARNIMHYLEGYAEERRAAPGDDLVSAIVTAKIGDRLLTHGEVMGMCMVLYLGGLDTVMSSLGWYFRHLASDQELQRRLREDPSLIPAAVDELLRAFGVTGTMRVVTEDLDFHGVAMKKGDWVTIPTYLAGRDPKKYPDPHVIDIGRKTRNLTLATGVHNCLGIHLAKREIKVVLEEWLPRFLNIRVPDGEKVEWHTGAVWGVDRLPLTWDK